MGFFETVWSYFRDEKQTQPKQSEALNRQHSEDPFADLREEIKDMSPEDVANTFAGMDQDTRVAFVRGKNISWTKWDEMRSMIKNDPMQRHFWGLGNPQTDIQDGMTVCSCHKEPTDTWTETKTFERAETAEFVRITKTIRSCRIEPTESTLARRAFIRVGNFHV